MGVEGAVVARSKYSDFYDRIARIERARLQGQGVEVMGALGRSYYHRSEASRRVQRAIGPMLLAVVCTFGLKATIHARIGADLYEQRVVELQSGHTFARMGGTFMEADPVTRWLSGQLDPYLR